jgi:hypothetical protein
LAGSSFTEWAFSRDSKARKNFRIESLLESLRGDIANLLSSQPSSGNIADILIREKRPRSV